MTGRKFQDKTLLLSPGKYYKLEIIKTIEFLPGGSWYVGRDCNGLRHLIPVSIYGNYGIEPGSVISCRLDRINCQGRFFFEPRHPYYSEGETYSFDLLGLQNCEEGSKTCYAMVRDIFGQELKTRPFNYPGTISGAVKSLTCRVIRIKKAVPYLEVSGIDIS
ncbi:MAG: hypothetical protein EA408_13410 [Marinilabiliales bacterium]|nr:MAG: hypothetical protein EA408_13410 [Marinilabiliales bacterium]